MLRILWVSLPFVSILSAPLVAEVLAFIPGVITFCCFVWLGTSAEHPISFPGETLKKAAGDYGLPLCGLGFSPSATVAKVFYLP
jgi:hypothetical protein